MNNVSIDESARGRKLIKLWTIEEAENSPEWELPADWVDPEMVDSGRIDDPLVWDDENVLKAVDLGDGQFVVGVCRGDVLFAAREIRERGTTRRSRAPQDRPPDKKSNGAWRDEGLVNVRFDAPPEPSDNLSTEPAADLEMCGIEWLWPGRFARGKFGLIAGLPDQGKGQIAAFLTAAVTANVELPCNEGSTTQGNVIWFNAEDGARDTLLPRLVAAGVGRQIV
jgi:AAA domain